MKLEQIYHELKQLAEKLGTPVAEHNFRTAGIHVRSSHCKIRGRDLFIIDKHLRLSKKVEVLADFLALQPIDDVFILPVIRILLEESRRSFTVKRDKGTYHENRQYS